MNRDTIVEGLLRPEAYPWRPAAVELIETHISWVFLAGDRVVKVKKPVDYGFIDHTSRESRRRSCTDEIRLNGRLSDGVYLRVAPITREGSDCRVDGRGTLVEWATLMRRLPAEGMLDALLAAGTVPPLLGERLAERLIPFHREAPTLRSRSAQEAGGGAAVAENLKEIQPFASQPLGTVQLGLVADALRGFTEDHADLLRDRAAAGWIREGHGDLRAEHVYFGPSGAGPIQVLDCVEFNRVLRCTDVASDLAFLLMDLERLGLAEIAATLVVRYREAGLDLPDALLGFYKAHRALVRAKVACLSRDLGDEAAGNDLADEAAYYLNLATAAAVAVRPTLVAMTGLSGTGKSTVAKALSRALGAPVFASDAVRKELAAQEELSPASAAGRGLYSRERTGRTYGRLRELATETLAAGRAVILDATFLDGGRREQLAGVAREADVPLILVETVCGEETATGRISARARHGGSLSDATVGVYRRQRAALTSPPTVPRGALHVRVDTDSGRSACLEPVLALMLREGILAARVPEQTEALHRCGQERRRRVRAGQA